MKKNCLNFLFFVFFISFFLMPSAVQAGDLPEWSKCQSDNDCSQSPEPLRCIKETGNSEGVCLNCIDNGLPKGNGKCCSGNDEEINWTKICFAKDQKPSCIKENRGTCGPGSPCCGDKTCRSPDNKEIVFTKVGDGVSGGYCFDRDEYQVCKSNDDSCAKNEDCCSENCKNQNGVKTCLEHGTAGSGSGGLPPGCEQIGSGNNVSFSCNTGLGIKIGANPQDFTKSLFGIILSISGAVAILLIIVSGYRLMASGGNPEKVKGAREQLTSAVVGLLFIIFSLVILEIIGVNILKIPGFTQ